MNETAEQMDIVDERDDDYTDEYDDAASGIIGTGFACAIAFIGGIVVDRFVVPVAKKAINSAREGLVKMLTNGKDENEHYVVESPDEKIVLMNEDSDKK